MNGGTNHTKFAGNKQFRQFFTVGDEVWWRPAENAFPGAWEPGVVVMDHNDGTYTVATNPKNMGNQRITGLPKRLRHNNLMPRNYYAI